MKINGKGNTFLLVLLFLLSITVVLYAGGTKEKAPGKVKAVSITFMTPPWGVPPDKEALKAFEAKSGIKVEVISLPMEQLYSKVQVATSAGQKPADVIFLSEEAPSFIIAPGFVAPLNDLINSDKSLNLKDFDRLDFWTVKGEVYGLPSYVQMVMMDYNKKKLEEAGFSKPPRTWEELREEAIKIKKEGIDQYPIAFGAIDWSWYLISLSMGDPMFDANYNPVFSKKGSKARKAMQLLLDFFKEGLITPAMLSETTPHAIFMGGTGVFHQSWQGAYVLMNNPKSSKQAPNVRYMLLPDVGNTWSLDAALGISSKCKNKKAAWEFIKWYVGKTNQVAIFNAFGLIPARRSIQEYLNKEGKIAQYDVLKEQAKHVHQLPRYVTWWGPWSSKVTENIRKGIQGNLSGDEVIDAIAKEWNSLKAQYSPGK